VIKGRINGGEAWASEVLARDLLSEREVQRILMKIQLKHSNANIHYSNSLHSLKSINSDDAGRGGIVGKCLACFARQ